MSPKKKPKPNKSPARKRDTDPVTHPENVAKIGAPIRQPNEVRRFSEELPCALRPEEIVFKADELGASIQDHDLLVEQKRAVNAGFNDRIKVLSMRISDLGAIVRLHTEKRSVECIECFVAETQTVHVIRQDTLEIVSERAANSEDVQGDMFPDGAPPDEENGEVLETPYAAEEDMP